MGKLVLWDKKSNQIVQGRGEMTPDQIMKEWTFTGYDDTLFEKVGSVVVAVQSLPAQCEMFGLDEKLPIEELVALINEKSAEARSGVSAEPTPDERIAAAMEFQNMVTMMEMEG